MFNWFKGLIKPKLEINKDNTKTNVVEDRSKNKNIGEVITNNNITSNDYKGAKFIINKNLDFFKIENYIDNKMIFWGKQHKESLMKTLINLIEEKFKKEKSNNIKFNDKYVKDQLLKMQESIDLRILINNSLHYSNNKEHAKIKKYQRILYSKLMYDECAKHSTEILSFIKILNFIKIQDLDLLFIHCEIFQLYSGFTLTLKEVLKTSKNTKTNTIKENPNQISDVIKVYSAKITGITKLINKYENNYGKITYKHYYNLRFNNLITCDNNIEIHIYKIFYFSLIPFIKKEWNEIDKMLTNLRSFEDPLFYESPPIKWQDNDVLPDELKILSNKLLNNIINKIPISFSQFNPNNKNKGYTIKLITAPIAQLGYYILNYTE